MPGWLVKMITPDLYRVLEIYEVRHPQQIPLLPYFTMFFYE